MRLLSLALAVVLVGGPIPEYPDRGEPIEDRALAADLVEADQRNGYMPDELLIEAESGTSRTCLLEREAAEAWNSLMVHAVHDEIVIRAISCYRRYHVQRTAFELNCPVKRTPVAEPPTELDDPAGDVPAAGDEADQSEDPVQPTIDDPGGDTPPPSDGSDGSAGDPPSGDAVDDPDGGLGDESPDDPQGDEMDPEVGEATVAVVRYTSERECRVPTARAGHSNHGWGRAIDLMSRAGMLTCRSKAFLWMQDHAHEYGWVHPPWARCGAPLEEPWHWEWAGVVEPETVVRLTVLAA